jgi:hypothetical protein
MPFQRRRFLQPDSPPLNLRRGTFRIWILLSVAWIMGWSIELVMRGIQGAFKTTNDVLEVLVLLFGPPIALLLFGLATAWAFRGFKADKAEPEA